MDAIGLNGNDLDVVLMQMVNLMRDGQPVRMSKRDVYKRQTVCFLQKRQYFFISRRSGLFFLFFVVL